MRNRSALLFLVLAGVSLSLAACGERSGSIQEVPAEELVAEVPELDAVHEFMQPLWHDAFPEKDFELIQNLVPQFEPAMEALAAVELQGILQDKAEEWEKGKANLAEAFGGLKSAAEAGNEEEMLGYAETFHMSYEGLVRLIRPVVPELDAFHQQLYGLFHYYGPGYDLEKIRSATASMKEALPPLQAVQLPSRLADHQDRFQELVAVLGEEVDALSTSLENPKRDEVELAIDAVHSAYAAVEALFD